MSPVPLGTGCDFATLPAVNTGRGPETAASGVLLGPAAPEALGLSRGFRERLLPLPAAGRLFALLFGEGASVGMFLWGFGSDGLVHYAVENQMPMAERRQLLAIMVSMGALFALAGATFLMRARTEAATRLRWGALKLAPLLLVGLLPLLFHWQIWVSRELTFGVLVCVVGFVLHACIAASQSVGTLTSSETLNALDRFGKRVLARVEPWAPALIVAASALFYTLYFSYYTILYHRSVLTMSYDLGLENNLVWNVIHGGEFMKSSPPFGPHGSHFGFHATLFAYVLGAFYFFHQQPETLLVLQAALIGGAAVPLYMFARSRIGRWSACVLAVMYVLYAPVHGSNLYDFHYLPLGVFFLWLTLWLVDAGHYKWGALAVLLTLSVREDVAADLTIIGAFMLFVGRRPRAGLVVALVAGVYFLLMKMVIMPRFLHGSESFLNQWQELVPPGGRGYAGVLMTVMGNPVYTLTSLLETQKFLYLVQIGAPFCFFAWRRPIGFLVSLPGFFFTILSTKYLPLVQISFQYTAHWTAFLFIAFVVCLEWTRQPKFAGDDGGWLRQRAWLLTACFTTVLTSYQYGAIFQQNTANGGFGRYKFRYTAEDQKRYTNLKALIALLPPMAKVTSSEYVVPHVSMRPNSYTLRNGLFDAEYILFELPARDDERGFVKEALKEKFGVVAVREPFALAKRGHDKAENHQVLKKLR
jgi:uncharacterized membrane protein